MNYVSSIGYKNAPVVSIGIISVFGKHSFALKWKDEFKGMCYLLKKTKLKKNLPLLEPLHPLLTSEYPKSVNFRHIFSNIQKVLFV